MCVAQFLADSCSLCFFLNSLVNNKLFMCECVCVHACMYVCVHAHTEVYMNMCLHVYV